MIYNKANYNQKKFSVKILKTFLQKKTRDHLATSFYILIVFKYNYKEIGKGNLAKTRDSKGVEKLFEEEINKFLSKKLLKNLKNKRF